MPYHHISKYNIIIQVATNLRACHVGGLHQLSKVIILHLKTTSLRNYYFIRASAFAAHDPGSDATEIKRISGFITRWHWRSSRKHGGKIWRVAAMFKYKGSFHWKKSSLSTKKSTKQAPI